MVSENSEILENIAKKLDLLIKLTAVNAIKDLTLKEQIILLKGANLQPKEIAEILNKTPNHIRVMLTHIKKTKGGE